MSQVIEVRFLDPESQEVLADEFTSVSSHREAINLALSAWSGGVGKLKSDPERIGEGTFVPAGANACWRYVYRCVLEDEDGEGKEAQAVLFAQYKEKA